MKFEGTERIQHQNRWWQDGWFKMLKQGDNTAYDANWLTPVTNYLHFYAVKPAAVTQLAWRGDDGVEHIVAGDLTGSGTANRLAYWTSATNLAAFSAGTSGQWMQSQGASLAVWTSPAALTKVDDTNVTLSLGGSPTTALLNAASLTLGWTGQLGLTRGGTAASLTAANGGVVYSTAAALAVNTPGSLGDWLKSAGAAAPTWTAPAALTKTDDTNVTLTLGGSPTTALLNAASLTLGWSGTLAVTRGGTGSSTALAAFNTLSPLTTRGDLLTRDASNNARVAVSSTAGTFLRSDGTDPGWSTLVLPNAASVNRIPFASAANTWSDSANLQFNGSTGTFRVATAGPHAFGSTLDNDRQFKIGGSFNGSTDAIGLSVSNTLNIPVGGNGFATEYGPTFTEAASGNHGIIASLITGMSITAGAATVGKAVGIYANNFTAQSGTTATASVYIPNQPSGGTSNYALWVDAGTVRIDGGTTGAQTATFTATNKPGSGTTSPDTWLPIDIDGTVHYIPCFL